MSTSKEVRPATTTVFSSTLSRHYTRGLLASQLEAKGFSWELTAHPFELIETDSGRVAVTAAVGSASLAWRKEKDGVRTLVVTDATGRVLGQEEVVKALGLVIDASNPEKLAKRLDRAMKEDAAYRTFTSEEVKIVIIEDADITHIDGGIAVSASFWATLQGTDKRQAARTRGALLGQFTMEHELGLNKGMAHVFDTLPGGADLIIPRSSFKKEVKLAAGEKMYFGATKFGSHKLASLSVQLVNGYWDFFQGHLQGWMDTSLASVVRSVCDGTVSEQFARWGEFDGEDGPDTFAMTRIARKQLNFAKWGHPTGKVFDLYMKQLASSNKKLSFPSPAIWAVIASDDVLMLAGFDGIERGHYAFDKARGVIWLNAEDLASDYWMLNSGGGDEDGDMLYCLPFIDMDGIEKLFAARIPNGAFEWLLLLPTVGQEIRPDFYGKALPVMDSSLLPIDLAAQAERGLVSFISLKSEEGEDNGVKRIMGEAGQLSAYRNNMALEGLDEALANRSAIGLGTHGQMVTVAAYYGDIRENGYIGAPIINLSDVVDVFINNSGDKIADPMSVLLSVFDAVAAERNHLPEWMMDRVPESKQELFYADGTHALDGAKHLWNNHMALTRAVKVAMQRRAFGDARIMRPDVAGLVPAAAIAWSAYADIVRESIAARQDEGLEGCDPEQLEIAREAALEAINGMGAILAPVHGEHVKHLLVAALLVYAHTNNRHAVDSEDVGIPKDALSWAPGRKYEEDGKAFHMSGMVDLTLAALEYLGVAQTPFLMEDGEVGFMLNLRQAATTVHSVRVENVAFNMVRSAAFAAKKPAPKTWAGLTSRQQTIWTHKAQAMDWNGAVTIEQTAFGLFASVGGKRVGVVRDITPGTYNVAAYGQVNGRGDVALVLAA